MSLCFVSSFRQENPQRNKTQIKREKELRERWPLIAGGRHSLLCNDYNVFASSTITTIVQKATKPNCQAETCNHCVGQKALAAI